MNCKKCATSKSASEGERTSVDPATWNARNFFSPFRAIARTVVLIAIFLTWIAAPAVAQTTTSSPATPASIAVVGVGAALSVVGALAAVLFGRRLTAAIGVDGMTRIALLAALHFAVSFSAKIANNVLAALAGPAALFVSEIGGELFPAIVQAVTVAVVRRPGALALSNLTVSIINGLCAGQLGPLDLWLALIGATLGELLLLATGATSWPPRDAARFSPSPSQGEGRGEGEARAQQTAPVSTDLPAAWTIRCVVALALYNGGVLLIQYSVYRVFFSLFFPAAYIASVVLIIGCLYGGIGATIGARWGVRLREIA